MTRPPRSARTLAAHAARIRAERLSVELPDARLGNAIARAVQLLDAQARADRPPDAALVRTMLAGLACGDHEAARDLIRGLRALSGARSRSATRSQLAAEVAAPVAALYPLLVARYRAWTGDASAAGNAALHADDVLEGWGADDEPGDPDPAEPEGLSGPARDPAGRDPAGTVLHFVHRVLGVAPDAPRNRIRLRPRLPAAWEWMDVRSLRIGDATVRLRYEKRQAGPSRGDIALHRFWLEQTAGPVPLTAILEPAVPGSRLQEARVDGRKAGLDARVERDRLLAPLQIVLDNERLLELEVENLGGQDAGAL